MKDSYNKKVNERYNTISKFYDFFMIPFEFLLVGRLREKLLSKAKGKVLELAIGTGTNLEYYQKNYDLTGIDMNKEMLKKAKQKADKKGLKIKLVSGDANKIPFKNKTFDIVVDTLGMCTYKEPIKVLKEMKRVCKNNGRILLLEHGASKISFIRRFQEKMDGRKNKTVGDNSSRNHEELVKKAGLKIEKIERYALGIFYLIIAKP